MAGQTKPSAKSVSKPVKKAAALPDRQVMEAFLNAKGSSAADAATGKAQQIMYDVWDTPASRTRIALAKEGFGEVAAMRGRLCAASLTAAMRHFAVDLRIGTHSR